MSVDATIATWKLKKVTAVQKLLLLSLADRAGESAECWPSIKRLMADTNLNRKTIIENRIILIKQGYIAFTGEYKGQNKQIPVMKLLYVNHREGLINIESDEYFTSTENGTGGSTENGTLNLKDKNLKKEEYTKPNCEPIGSRPTKSFSKIKSGPYIEVWNELAASVGCPKMGADKKRIASIEKSLMKIQKEWQEDLNPDNFYIWLDNAIKNNFYMICKFKNRMDVCIRPEHFMDAYNQVEEVLKT